VRGTLEREGEKLQRWCSFHCKNEWAHGFSVEGFHYNVSEQIALAVLRNHVIDLKDMDDRPMAEALIRKAVKETISLPGNAGKLRLEGDVLLHPDVYKFLTALGRNFATAL
jgi:hypothetical protein